MSDNTQDQIKELKEQVDKLKVLLASTGQQVLQLQMELRNSKIQEIDTKTKELQTLVPGVDAKSGIKNSDIVTESDLNDMVMELQDQLNILDTRSIIRTFNSRSESKICGLPNSDHETHPRFPETIESLQKLDDKALFEQWNFIEMISESLEDLIEPNNPESNAKLMNEIYQSFTRFIGVDCVKYPRST